MGGSSSTEGNVSVMAMESVMRNMNPTRSSSSSRSSTALSITAAIGGLLVLLTLLVGGPMACVCFVAMYVKKLRKRAKRARSLVFASQWRAQNRLLPYPNALQKYAERATSKQQQQQEEQGQEGKGETEGEAEKGTIFTWPCFLYTAIPPDFNGLSTAFFQSPSPIIFRTCGGATPEFIRFNPGIGSKRQEQSVQCSYPLLAGSKLPSASSFTYFEVTIVGFNKEKNSSRLFPPLPETKVATNGEYTEEIARNEGRAALGLDEKLKGVSLDKSLTSVYISEKVIKATSEAIQIQEESWLPSPFDQMNREAFEASCNANVGFQDHGEHHIEVMMQGKAPAQVVIEGTLAIGLAACPAPPFRLPGRDAISVALHSKSGRLFMNNLQEGEPFAALPGWGRVGATVGCGFDMATQTVCFTIEGVCYNTNFDVTSNALCHSHSNVAIDDDGDSDQTVEGNEAKYPLFPTIGADCDVTVWVNLGQERFKFMPGSCSTLQQ